MKKGASGGATAAAILLLTAWLSGAHPGQAGEIRGTGAASALIAPNDGAVAFVAFNETEVRSNDLLPWAEVSFSGSAPKAPSGAQMAADEYPEPENTPGGAYPEPGQTSIPEQPTGYPEPAETETPGAPNIPWLPTRPATDTPSAIPTSTLGGTPTTLPSLTSTVHPSATLNAPSVASPATTTPTRTATRIAAPSAIASTPDRLVATPDEVAMLIGTAVARTRATPSTSSTGGPAPLVRYGGLVLLIALVLVLGAYVALLARQRRFPR